MPDEDLSVRERLTQVAQMDQEPKDRLWAVIIVVALLVFLLGGVLIETRLYLAEGRDLGYQRGAVDCLTVAVDDDRDFELPKYCYDPSLVVYYPQSACDLYFQDVGRCGVGESTR